MNDLIAAHLTWLGNEHQSPKTIANRRFLLCKADRELPHGLAATHHEIQVWLGRTPTAPRRGTYAAKTRATYFENLKAFFDWAVDEAEVLDYNPMLRLRKPRVPRAVPRPCTDAQLAVVLGSAQPYRLAVVLAAYAGLRCCEIARLAPGDVDQDYLRVVGKGGHVDEIETHPRVWAELQAILHDGGSPITKRPEPFIVQAGGWADPARISSRASVYFRRHHNLRVTMHQFRHWYVTTVANRTDNLEAARQAARHASLATTQRYVLLRNGQRKTGICSLPVLDATVS